MAKEHYRGWIPPEGADSQERKLRLYNSLTDRKEVFVPNDGPSSKKITWYSCGPTVYDSAHMGHSRNYVTIDILRRVLEDYFGYTILFVMNITDVEDKIVLRARRNHLLKRYQQQATDISQVKADADGALEGCIEKQEAAKRGVEEQLAEASEAVNRAEIAIKQATGKQEVSSLEHQRKKKARQVSDLEDALKVEDYKLNHLWKIRKKLTAEFPLAKEEAQRGDVAAAVQRLVSVVGEQLALWQDSLHKAEVTDERIFRKHAAKYEREFWHDMDLLGTRRPTVLTRVTEYMPQIIDYISKIMENGFAYTSIPEEANGNASVANGSAKGLSVYFDTAAFEKSGHMYPKLNPWAAGVTALAADGEANFVTSEKKNPKDFALWKAGKPGEPTWPSPWGQGRPGWHIECSAMASSIIGQKVDIHTGGEDLRFPHHDNELAQAEAFYHKECGCDAQWVNYFVHSGHLSINGLKMSKSTKNFITIREALETFTARQLRLMFALQPWNKAMNFGKTIREEMRAKEHVFKFFFYNVDVLLRKHTPVLVMDGVEKELERKIDEAKKNVEECLLDNLNTSGAIDALVKLVTATNKYMKEREDNLATNPTGPAPHPYLLRESARTLTHVLRVFGISTAGLDDLGFGGPGLTASQEQLLHVFRDFRHSIASSPEMHKVCSNLDLSDDCELSQSSAAHVLDALIDFRNNVRNCAKVHRLRHILDVCDRIRDQTMPDLGVRVEDRPDGSSVWMAEDPAELRAERKEREEAIKAAILDKRVQALEDNRRLLRKMKKQAALPTVQQALQKSYSRFDGEGQDANPTHDAEGVPLAAGELKKGKSAADKARKPRAFYDKQVQEKGLEHFAALQREVEQMTAEIGISDSNTSPESPKPTKKKGGKSQSTV